MTASGPPETADPGELGEVARLHRAGALGSPLVDRRPGSPVDVARAGGVAGPRTADWDVKTPPLEWEGLVTPPAGGRGLPSPPPGWWRLHAAPAAAGPPVGERLIFDLCAGSGEWSRPYVDAGYIVVRVDLPLDVRTWTPPARPWGILAAPPCNEFSRAKRGERDYVAGMEVVNACLRLVAQCRPRWWALENPQQGDLSKFLGFPQWTFQPYDFGDPWTKATGIWGEFNPPCDRRPVPPVGSAMDRRTSAARAVTPPGFARAFFGANP